MVDDGETVGRSVETSENHSSDQRELLQLTLDIWHPDCWTLEVTADHEAGLLAHGSYRTVGDSVKGRFTVFSDTNDEVDAAIDAIEGNALTDAVHELHEGFAKDTGTLPGNATTEIFVEYRPENSIDHELTSRGFIREKPIRIVDGIETWSVAIHATRHEMQLALDGIRSAMEADIDVTQITTSSDSKSGSSPRSLLSDRQREAFQIAQDRGYYEWPREVSAQKLAAELDLSKTTFLEHLRKAEAKLLEQVL